MKDVMRHQSGEEKKRKKPAVLSETGSKERHPETELLTDDEIDHADF
jgi:hypothetical protein